VENRKTLFSLTKQLPSRKQKTKFLRTPTGRESGIERPRNNRVFHFSYMIRSRDPSKDHSSDVQPNSYPSRGTKCVYVGGGGRGRWTPALIIQRLLWKIGKLHFH